jgi:hypothetical protein
MEIPLSTPKPMTVLESKGLCSKNFIHNATCREQNVTSRCQLVKVVAAAHKNYKSLKSELHAPVLLSNKVF